MSENCANHNDHQQNFINQRLINTDYERRITSMERRMDVSDEKFRQVFEKLDTIIKILETSSSRLPNMVWGVSGSVFGGVLVWAILSKLG